MFGMDNVVTDDIFINLATRPGLRTLGLQKRLTPQLISSAAYNEQGLRTQGQTQGQRQLFPDLHELTCTAEAEGILSLSSHLPQLAHLELTLVSNYAFTTPSDGLLPLLSNACPNLQFLDISYNATGTTDLHPTELLILAQKLQHLKHLHLHGDNILARELQDAHIVRMAQYLKEVEVLQLGFKCTLTDKALRGVGEYCGNTLVECELQATCNLSSLDREDALFPALRELIIGQVSHSSNSPDQIINEAKMLQRCAPRLEFFQSIGEGSFGKAVENAWRRLSQQHSCNMLRSRL
jgi:hypothetical protein